MSNHKFPYKWYLKDGYPAKGIKPNELTVFGTFICGGGSTMGYKLAGFTHIGGVEIDKEVAAVYKINHKPKHLYNEDIRDFVKRNDIPKELYNLDILDGSPPCSSFSMAGNREKDWGKEKVFREGQAMQTLDDLFFDYIELAKKLQPKVVIAENVKGLIQGNAKSYVHKIKTQFEDAGYDVQLFLLNAATMGVPQKRERVFFICRRKDLNLPKIFMNFYEKPIVFKELIVDDNNDNEKELTELELSYYNVSKQGDSVGKFFSNKRYHNNKVPGTIVSGSTYYHPTISRHINNQEFKLIGSYPLDYNFIKTEPKYLIGMSVPPVMTAQIAHQIYLQWFKKD